MSETESSPIGVAVCEVCAQPMPAGARPVRVGACEFPFHVHEACRDAMGPLAEEITLMCAAAAPAEQPEGLLWLGSWEPLVAGDGSDRVENTSS
jgi:hypothetical protein